MASKSKNLTWLTPLGQNVHENLNPLWFYCEQTQRAPTGIVVLHDEEMASAKDKVVKVLAAVVEAYGTKNKVRVRTLSFDDEDIHDFTEKAKSVFESTKSENGQLIVDLSPTTWSYISILLMKMAETHRKIVRSAFYLQYASHGSRSVPYPLISRLSRNVFGLLAVEKE